MTKQKIAILGGGVGAITAAYQLTEKPGWQDRYEITVYQMGWRLGGKGASGRNRDLGDRIEEHGLHLWFGYYHNAFNLIRRCYAALGRSGTAPLASWEEAFKPHSLFLLHQFDGSSWTAWENAPPDRSGKPGDQTDQPNIFELVKRLTQWLLGHRTGGLAGDLAALVSEQLFTWLEGLVPLLDALANNPKDAEKLQQLLQMSADIDPLGIISKPLGAVTKLANQGLGAATAALSPLGKLAAIGQKIAGFVLPGKSAPAGQALANAAPTAAPTNANEKRLPPLDQLVLVGAYVMKGLIADRLLPDNFAAINDLDMREWLARHGAGPKVTESEAMRVAYEAAFAFSKGSYHLPDVAAGTGIRNYLNLIFGYRGAFAWKMQAGMGDVVFAPLYQVLKQRGVKFEFFHKVKDLVPSADGKTIEQIVIGRQVRIKDGKDYQPLYDVKGLPCWPSKPIYEQIEGSQALLDGEINLESHWHPAPEAEELTLARGTHFDKVVLGISLGGLPHIAARLVAQKPKWRNMVNYVETIQTQAFQIWLKDPVDARQPVHGGFAQPHNTAADMSHLIARENWPIGNQPGAIYYFCGPKSQNVDLPDPDQSAFPATATFAAGVRASQWLRSCFPVIDNTAAQRGFPSGFPVSFDYSRLYVGDAPDGAVAPFSTQFWRANIDPSERYVLSTRGSIQYRLKANASGYANLTLAGDWTDNGINIGCVEAAVVSGMQAAAAL